MDTGISSTSRKLVTAILGLGAVAFLATPARAQVERVELDIAGHLCGF